MGNGNQKEENMLTKINAKNQLKKSILWRMVTGILSLLMLFSVSRCERQADAELQGDSQQETITMTVGINSDEAWMMTGKQKYHEYIVSYSDKSLTDYLPWAEAILEAVDADPKEFQFISEEVDGMESQIIKEMDGERQLWLWNNGIAYSNPSIQVEGDGAETGGPDIEAAAVTLQEIAKQLGLPVSDRAEIEDYGYGARILYRMTFEGVEMPGKEVFTFTADDMEKSLTGAYIFGEVSREGLSQICISNAPDEAISFASYDPDKDLLTEEELWTYVNEYLNTRFEQFGKNVDEVVLKEQRLVYMPYRMDKDDVHLVPAYELKIHTTENGRGRTRHLFLDARTGFVYYSQFLLD